MLNGTDRETSPLLPPVRDQHGPHEGNRENDVNDHRYILCRNKEEFERAYNTEAYRQSLNYRSLEYLREPILAKESEYRQRDEDEFLRVFKEAQEGNDQGIETKIGNCLCKCS